MVLFFTQKDKIGNVVVLLITVSMMNIITFWYLTYKRFIDKTMYSCMFSFTIIASQNNCQVITLFIPIRENFFFTI